jgi:hypothetical protein
MALGHWEGEELVVSWNGELICKPVVDDAASLPVRLVYGDLLQYVFVLIGNDLGKIMVGE